MIPANTSADTSPVHVIGATGRSGQALCRALVAADIPVIPVVRNPVKWLNSGLPGTPLSADLAVDPRAAACLAVALASATRIVSCAHARHTPAILAAAPAHARLVLLGSTRRFTQWPDAHGNGVIEGEGALLASGRGGVMLHPTMIYGAAGENNVQRLARLIARLPVLPLPGGGHALVQPIYQDDLTRCILAALSIAWTTPATLVVAGPAPLAYADFVRAIARAARLPAPRIVPVPAAVLMAAAPVARLLPGLPGIGADEVRRLVEDKAFDTAPMIETLGITPIPLDEGLSRMWPDRTLALEEAGPMRQG